MSWVLSLSILSSICRVYIYVRLNIYYVERRTCYFVSPFACTTGRWAFGCSDTVMVDILKKIPWNRIHPAGPLD